MTDLRLSDPIEADAIGWVVRVNDPAFGDWDDFTRWLDADPAHADAYHAAAAAEADAVALLASAPREIEVAPMPSRPRWRPWIGTAIAASLVAVIGFHVMERAPAPQIYETAPGVRRTVALADGSVVILNGGTRLSIDGSDSRSLTLERGEGLFAVRHDASHPFRVAVGGATVTDIGTAFDIVREPAATRVTVAEGEVEWGHGGKAVRLLAGDRLAIADNAVTVEISKVMPDTVGDWSRGQLNFDGAPLANAATDLGRALGVSIDVAPTIAQRPVRGAIRLDGGAAAVMPRFAALMGLRARQDGQDWRLTAAP